MQFVKPRRLRLDEMMELLGTGGGGRLLVAPGFMVAPLGLTRTGTAATALAPDNATDVTYAANLPRFNGTERGLLLEAARANLLASPAVLATQDVVVTAVAHTLSFRGTGTITLSGASTAGPLVGTGANNRVTLTFTPSAATLTLTVSGDVRSANLEIGASATSFINGTASRGADTCTATLASLGLTASGLGTFVFRGLVPTPIAAAHNLIQIDDGGANNRYVARVNSAVGDLSCFRTTGGSSVATTTPGTITANTLFGFAMSVDGAGRMAVSFNGGAVQAATGGPTSGLTTLRLGINNAGTQNLNGECRLFRVLPYITPDGQLRALSAL